MGSGSELLRRRLFGPQSAIDLKSQILRWMVSCGVWNKEFDGQICGIRSADYQPISLVIVPKWT